MKMTSHVKSAPNIASAIISKNEWPGSMTLSTAASAAPELDTASARKGTPRWLTTPSALGACPPRARLNSMRVDTYNCAFIDDKAAVSLTVVTESTLTDALRKVSLLTPDSAAKAGAGKLLILSAQAGSFDPIAIHDLDRTDLSSLIAGMKRSDVAFLVQRH